MPKSSTTKSPTAKRKQPEKKRAKTSSSRSASSRSKRARPNRKQRENDHQDPETGARRPLWSGTLSFGLVSIPVEMFAATRRKRAPLKLLSPDGAPLSRRFYSPLDGEEVADDELARGYELKPGQYVLVTDDELRALEPEKSRDIDLQQFVDASEISPLYFDRAFYLLPSGTSTKAYALLMRVMERSKRAAIATFVMHDSEYVIAILVDPDAGVLRGQTLRFHADVRSVADVGLPDPIKPPRALRERFEQAIGVVAKTPWSPKEISDDGADKVIALAKAKQAEGADVVSLEPTEIRQPMADVIDLMDALKRSIATDQPSHSGRARSRKR